MDTDLMDPLLGETLSTTNLMAIHELMHRICLTEDNRNYDALRHLFTQHALHERALYGRAEGVDNIAKFVRESQQSGFYGIRHHAPNIVIARANAKTERSVSYVLPMKLFPPADEEDDDLTRLLAHGVVRDRIMKDGQL